MFQINNRDLRRLWLWSNGLANTPTGPLDVMQIIRDLGFVQIDTIRNVTRAHHHIIWSRNQNYKEKLLWPILKKRELFEHFTHDASLIPMDLYPNWQLQFHRLGQKVKRSEWYQSGLAEEEIRNIRSRIEREGPLSTHAFETKAKSKAMWSRPPHKKALDQMWYAGELATSHRENFVKFYDLGERVFPTLEGNQLQQNEQVYYLCNQAINRLKIASCGEIQRFWDAASNKVVREWADQTDLLPVKIQDADGKWTESLAVPDIEHQILQAPSPTSRLRILNPFDPAIRDRTRLQKIFGFEYRNEMFVPADQRIWGYYVYPLLEGDRFVGRIELNGDRTARVLTVTGFWPEPKIKWTTTRYEKLEAELIRFGRLTELKELVWKHDKGSL